MSTQNSERSVDDPDARPWRDEDTLRELYVDEHLTQAEIGDKLGVEEGTISHWLDKLGIETRTITDYSHGIEFRIPSNLDYYPRIIHQYKGETDYIPSHRLLAVAEYGFGAVVGNQAHLKNGCPVDNRPQNIIPLSPERHQEIHFLERGGTSLKHTDREWLEEQYENHTQEEIAEKCGCTTRTIRNWLSRFGLTEGGNRDEMYRDKAWLREKMSTNTQREVADMCGCTPRTIRKWVNIHDLKQEWSWGPDCEDYKDEGWLQEKWRSNSAPEIAEMCGCSADTIRAWLDRHGIRERGER